MARVMGNRPPNWLGAGTQRVYYAQKNSCALHKETLTPENPLGERFLAIPNPLWPVLLIVLPKSCSCRCEDRGGGGPCPPKERKKEHGELRQPKGGWPPPIPRLGDLFSFFRFSTLTRQGRGDWRRLAHQKKFSAGPHRVCASIIGHIAPRPWIAGSWM